MVKYAGYPIHLDYAVRETCVRRSSPKGPESGRGSGIVFDPTDRVKNGTLTEPQRHGEYEEELGIPGRLADPVGIQAEQIGCLWISTPAV